MGIIPPGGFGNNCNLCFDPGATPSNIILTFSGIKQGNDFGPGDPAPPNFTFNCSQNVAVACLWQFQVIGFTASLNFGIGQSRFVFNFFGPFKNVFTSNVAECTYFGVNQFQNPAGRTYFGGSVQAWIL